MGSDVFDKYQATPEYQQVNTRHERSDAFKGIFWWEYFHRLLGRAIGMVFLLPLLWFIARAQDPAGLCVRSSSASSCSERCKVRWAGTWSKRARRRSARLATTV